VHLTVTSFRSVPEPENFASTKELGKTMRDQSAQGVDQLKALVEKILA